MSDDRPEDEAERPAAPEPDTDHAPASTTEAAVVERRAFLRQITGEAVVTSGRLAGLSSVVRRTVFAAVESAAVGDAPLAPEPDPAIGSEPTPPEERLVAPAAAATSATAAGAVTPASPAALTPQQEALLMSAAGAVLGTNDAAGAPHLTASRFGWDGTIVRLPSDLFAARVERIDADPRVSLLIGGDGPDAWVAISGTATVVAGDAVEAGMMSILRKYMTDDEAALSWTELRASGNPVVIEVRPSRYLWRLE